MQTFVIRPMTWPVLRLFSRNPLIRASDRIESGIVTLAVLFVVVAAAGAGVIGTLIHDARAQEYHEQARTRHTVVAWAIDDGKPTASSTTIRFTVHARWKANGIDHVELIGWNRTVQAGDSLQLWVDAQGRPAAPPKPVERAGTEAVSAAVIGWTIAALAAAEAVGAVRAHLQRTRDTEWDRDIRSLVDGGFTNR
ncbi:Rv1733c family protein [Mycobacterium paraterrae]|uniref:Transmembrane protein n=1 Tax=Mycobacterium paraterrae TaxID=577492 RepID=A0ABY3VWB9_9MYCO|nr:hypothetical protein [Mycobacterium paraterrae]UMB70895.1 hypothetical protein MKK62_06300 [Mycobacterium paraterrae]